jgi:mannose-6-phosphate isomerase-like protein (cupin superfamily)
LILYPGDVIEIPVGLRHQMFSLTGGELIEISTEHFEDDSYRVIKGD